MATLTKSQENYLEIIYKLSLYTEGVHISDIAAMFNVTKTSASVAVKALQKMSLVRRDAHRLVYLTDEGRNQAKRVSKTFLIIYEFLTKVLAVDTKTAYEDSGAMEHRVSSETTCALCRYIKQQDCDNGCAIPMSAIHNATL